MKEAILEAIREHRIIAILRRIPSDRISGVIDALYEGGIRLLEITFDQQSPSRHADTAAAIRYARQAHPNRLRVGAGTVMTPEDLRAAADAGAEFILSPNIGREVIEQAVHLGICAISSAMTPFEIADAHAWGAACVKLFPAGNLGLAYCRAVMAPLNHIPMIAVGGIDEGNLPGFLQAGFIGAGIGSSLTDSALIRSRDFKGLRERAARYVQLANISASDKTNR